MLSYDELTAPEREVWDAFPEGRPVDLRTGVPEDDQVARGGGWGPGRTVRAAVVVALLQDANAARPGAVASLRLTGARLTGPLDLAGAEIAHALWLDGCWFEEGIDLSGAATRSIAIRDSRVPSVEAGLIRTEGRFDLRRTRVECGAASPFHRRVTALSLINAHVSGAVSLNGAEVVAPGEWAVSAGGLVAEGGLYAQDGFVAHGELRLMGAQLPGGLHMRGARLERPSPRGVALALDNAVASTLDFSSGFTAHGTVRLRGAQVSDRATFAEAVLAGPPDGGGPCLAAPLLRAVDLDLTLAGRPSGAVDLRGAQVSQLYDTGPSWPDVVELDGFVYGSLMGDDEAGRRDAVAGRVAWIRRGPGYSPQPYEQLASWYRRDGHDDDARRVLLAKQRHRRGTLPPVTRAWGYLLDATVGYGYRPWLAGVWLLALTVLGTAAFGAGSPAPAKPGEGAPFHPLVYTLDLVIPIGGLGQRTAWYWPDDGLQALAHALIALGWVLTTAVVAGVTRALQKN
ncbi:oxidoreductase [Streptomyces sp. NPDC048172]|uniref:oxidoreductase n=1 Tax=Streptomyces sp. NPDC048172 TaxID=3365505 RepID=UPI003723E48E